MSSKKRVQFDLSPATMARLEMLKDKTEAASYAEVFKNAIRIYEWLIEEAGQSARVVIARPDGTTAIVPIFS